ncbi:MAG: RluA family pseudouridine synthase [Verrucomicrobiota bacterium JB023]|nr:RluA family pseudouridine synthase [Verrucomicrobiota bacterium JB023]
MDEARRKELEERWRVVAESQPGCVPYLNRRPCRIRQHEDGLTVAEMLEGRFPGKLGLDGWREVIAKGEILTADNEVVHDPGMRVKAGDRLIRCLPEWVEPRVATDLRIVYEDDILLVVDKPAPLPMHEGGRFYKNTIAWMMREAWPEMGVQHGHRLDAETSGVLICVKTKATVPGAWKDWNNSVQGQFERGEVEKEYLALVHGSPEWEKKLIEHPVRQTGRDWGKPQESQTIGEVLERRGDGTTLMRMRPLTGRTHQIRVHLWEEGHSIVGDRLYLPDHEKGGFTIASPGEDGLCLRAWKLRMKHPLSGEAIEFSVSGDRF